MNYERYRDHELDIPNDIVKLVLESKIKNLPLGILRNAVPHAPTEKHLDSYKEYVKNNGSRVAIKSEDLHFFPEWEGIQRHLTKMYGNAVDVYNSLMQTNELSVNKIHASLHADQSDVVHLCCYGRVDWILIDPEDKKEYNITLEPGDVMYMRGFVLHETIPLSPRGSLIFMNLPYSKFPEPDLSVLTDEEKEAVLKEQKEGYLKMIKES